MQIHHDVRRTIALGTVAALVACSGQRSVQTPNTPSSQQAYEYPGCSNSDAECPRLGTLTCALRTIVRKHNACSQHDDCVEASIEPKCSGAGTCPPYFVNRQAKTAFEGEAQGEIERYCQTATCSLPGLCPVPGTVQGYCASGHCTWIKTTGP